MVYGQSIDGNRGPMGLSTTEVLSILKVTKVTLYKWILQGKIKPKRYKIGSRVYNDFEPEEVLRVRSLLKEVREKGHSVLKDQ